MRHSLTAFCLFFGLAAGCGPSSPGDGDGDGTPDAAGSDRDGGGGSSDARTWPDAAAPATLKGRVWAPNMAPGQARPGEEIPIFGALVYVSDARPPAIPREVFCQPCVETPPGGVYSSHDGSFTLEAQPGTYWLVIEKGQFRLEQQVTVQSGQAIELTAAQTTLPSAHDPANGAWLPKMAIVMGSDDQIEDVLGKLGIGEVDATGVFVSHRDEIDVYGNGGRSRVIPTMSGNQLLADPNRLDDYHVIFFACSTTSLNLTPQVRKNIRNYIKAGGKIYVTDWTGEVMDQAFPPQITLGDSGADTAGTYSWQNNTDTFIGFPGDSDGALYNSPDGQAVDPDLNTWLGMQEASLSNDGAPLPIDANRFEVSHNYNWIRAVSEVEVGRDDAGMPIKNTPKVWVSGSNPNLRGDSSKHPLSVTFEPMGCGRVLYSTYQTSNGAHKPLYPQERVLLYLIMEIGVCTATVPPVD